MEFESTNSGTTVKLPILKLENGDSWVSVPQTVHENGTSVTKMSIPVTTEEKTNKKNDVKARSLLLMALPNEHQLTFSQYLNAKSMFAAIETRFGGNAATKKTQKTLLKQQYKNFSAIISTASPNVNAASPQVSTAGVSYNVVYAFMVENPNGSNVLHQDLDQIHEDDLEAMDLKWQLSLLSVKAKKYYQRTGKKIFINANNIARYDKSKCDGLLVKLNESEFKATTYKRGLATLEDKIITYKKNEVLFTEEIGFLKRKVACKDYEINMLKSEFEKVKQENDGIEFKIEKFDKASKDLDQLLGSQITNKSKKVLRYSAVPPPHPLIYNRPKKLDLSYSGLDEFKEPEFKGYGLENSKQESNVVCDKKIR
ncbi:hypothetical protein Tco_0915395 [Tanacetum coccineum]